MIDLLREQLGLLTARVAEIESLLKEKGIEKKPVERTPEKPPEEKPEEHAEANRGRVEMEEEPDEVAPPRGRRR